jgi:predicted GH43/DUF377 family glycosyl hydrolase
MLPMLCESGREPGSCVVNASPISNDLLVRRLPIRFEGDDRRVIVRPFIMGSGRVRTLFERIEQIDEQTAARLLLEVEASYGDRHAGLRATFQEHFAMGAELIAWNADWSTARRALAGAYLTMEYAVDSAALFNPSIVPHPDQTSLRPGEVRFLMSLRATGEGHVSSIVFRTGIITPQLDVRVDPLPAKLRRSRLAPDLAYERALFGRKLGEMGADAVTMDRVLERVGERFTQAELSAAVEQARPALEGVLQAERTLRTIQFLARSNYHIDLPQGMPLSELVIFPMSQDESRGIEDLRMVRFVEDDGDVSYFGTYTAYNGVRTLPMLLCCRDFRRIEIHSLNGSAALNKGMALFPRRIDGKYAMCTRIDGENLFISYSDSVHFWETAQRLMTPTYPWELMQVGNCGSPIETPRGWLLLTHGVGPIRSYAIGALLLDLQNPLKVLGHLKRPLIFPLPEEREGYVPNVVYTCGAMVHRGQLLIPYGQADKSTGISVVDLNALLGQLIADGTG